MWKVIILLFMVCGNIFVFAQKLQPLTGLATGEERIKPLDKTIENEVINLTNKEREKVGLPPLTTLISLTEAARYHAYDMAVDNYFGHDSRDKKQDSTVFIAVGSKRISQFLGTSVYYAGEHIYKSYITKKHKPSAVKVIRKWMSSTEHRGNILSRNIKYVGVGFYQVGKTYYIVEVFGM